MCFVLFLKVLAKLHGLQWKELRRLADVQKAMGKTLEEMYVFQIR